MNAVKRLVCWWQGCGWEVTWHRWTGEVIESRPRPRCGRDHRGEWRP